MGCGGPNLQQFASTRIWMNNLPTMANTNESNSRSEFKATLLNSPSMSTAKVVLLWVAILIVAVAVRTLLVG
jgi:hypothetical protein